MSSKNIIIKGSGGGGGRQHTPVEADNTHQSKTTAKIVDVLCEGEISGPANDDNWYKSSYFNETQVMNDDGDLNFQGVTMSGRLGEESPTDSLVEFDSVDNLVILSTELLLSSSPYTITITDSDVDSVYLTMEFPALLSQADNGDINETNVQFHVDVVGDNGSGFPNHVITTEDKGKIVGKWVSPYRKQFKIEGLYDNYGVGPWLIRIYRDTADWSSAKTQNRTYIYSYTESKEIKMLYPDTACIGLTLDSEIFGGSVPARAYKIKGRKIQVPSNYTPATRAYTGVWDGNFKTAWTDNPAWVVYDVLTNGRFGLGDYIDSTLNDKWTLYTIAQYNDQLVTVSKRQRTDGGDYTETETTEPRFTFNGGLYTREQALAVINHICSVFRGYPLWTSGSISFVQDSPKDITRIANQANVKGGLFEYEGTGQDTITTAAKVSYNNNELFGRSDTVLLEDEAGITTYGYNPADIACFGCTSKTEAIRRAKYILYTDINQIEFVKFVGGLEWADAIPGEIVGIQDKDYVSADLSGRVISATTTSITVDRTVTIAGGETYTLYVADNETTAVVEKILTNSVGDATVLTWTGAVSEAPKAGQIWALTKSTVSDIREFQITNIKESSEDKEYEIYAVLYYGSKYAEVEEGIVEELPPSTNLPTGALDPPSNIEIQSYTYTEGDSENRKYAMLISWVASPDVRTQSYELEYRLGTGVFVKLDSTLLLSYDFKNVVSGTYSIRVRAISVSGYSRWVNKYNYIMVASINSIAAVTGLDTIDDPSNDRFTGPDCEIEWEASAGAYYSSDSTSELYINDGTDVILLDLDSTSAVGVDTIAGYQVEVYTVADVLLRTYQTADNLELIYNYTYNMNFDDNSGSPIRQIKFKVYAIDRYGNFSAAATLVANNPAPDMSSTLPVVTPGYGYLKVDWASVSDSDMSHYKIYADTNATPTTEVAQLAYPATQHDIFNIDVGTVYYVQIEPYDGFGVGTKSQIPGGETPVIIPGINVDAELSGSITATDSDGNSAETLARLYDRIYDSTGVTYVVSGTDKYVEYSYKITDYCDRVAIWTADANATVYCATYVKETDTWTYFKDAGDDENLEAANNQADAQANLWSVDEALLGGIRRNIRIMPNNVIADKFRIYIRGSYTTTFYEMYPSRIIISELAAIGHLSAISSDIGTIIAGTIQSKDYSGTEGMIIDLDDKDIEIRHESEDRLIYDGDTGDLAITSVVTFQAGTTGIANTDAGDLAVLDEVEWADVADGATTKPANSADVTANNTAADAAAYTGAKIDAAYTDADVTANNTAANVVTVGSVPATHVAGWAATDTTKIDGGDIYTNTITANAIKALTITADQIAANTITSDEIAANTIKAGQIAVNTITANNLAAGCVTASEVSTNEIIASAANIKNAVITGAKIGTAQVDTLQIKGQAVTIPVGAYTAGELISNSGGLVTIQSASITSSGAPIFIFVSAFLKWVNLHSTVYLYIYRDGSIIYTAIPDVTGYFLWTTHIKDTPGAGTHTYYFRCGYISSYEKFYYKNRSLLLLETKR